MKILLTVESVSKDRNTIQCFEYCVALSLSLNHFFDI